MAKPDYDRLIKRSMRLTSGGLILTTVGILQFVIIGTFASSFSSFVVEASMISGAVISTIGFLMIQKAIDLRILSHESEEKSETIF